MAKESQFDHEIALTPYTAAPNRLMLMKDENGRSLCTVTEDVQPHASQLKFIQKDWSGGHGQYDMNAPSSFFEGKNIDIHSPGRVFLGPETITLVVDNFSVCVADDGGALTTQTSEAASITVNDLTLLPAAPVQEDAYYFGAASKFTYIYVHIGTNGAGTWTITWEYYNGATWVALSIADEDINSFKGGTGVRYVSFSAPASWATTTINSIANTYWVRARLSAYTAITTQPKGNQAWVGTSTGDMGESPVETCYFPDTGNWFCATATKVYEYLSASNSWRQRLVLTGQSITDLKAHANSTDIYLLLGLGTGDEYYYSTDGATWTQAAAHANNFATKFLSAPNQLGTSNVLWIGHNSNIMQGGNSAIDFSAATPIQIGDTSYVITNLFLHNDNLLIGKQGGLYQIDADGAVHYLMTYLRDNASSRNFKYVANYRGSFIFSICDGLIEISASNSIRDIGPLTGIEDIAKIGTCVGIAADKDFLYIAMDEGTDVVIYKGKEGIFGGETKWSWCPWKTLASSSCAVIRILPGSVTSSTPIRYLSFGQNNYMHTIFITEKSTDDTNARFNTDGGFVRMSYTCGNNPYADKLWQSVLMQTIGCAASITTQVKYRKDTDTSASTCTSASTANGTNKTNLTSALACNRIQFQIDLATNDSTKTPEVSYFEARGVEKPEVVRTYECVYYVGDTPSQRASTIRTFLRNCRASTSLVKLADLRWGESTVDTTYHWVTMAAGFPTEVSLLQEKGHIEIGLKVKWQEVSFTVS